MAFGRAEAVEELGHGHFCRTRLGLATAHERPCSGHEPGLLEQQGRLVWVAGEV